MLLTPIDTRPSAAERPRPAAGGLAWWALAAALVLLVAAAGCNVLGVVAAKALPPPKRPAAYVLGEVAVAVRVEPAPRVYGESGPTDAEAVAVATERALRDRTQATVSPADAAAKFVYAVLDPTSAQTLAGSDLRTGRAAATVRVLDADGRELWPLDGTPGRRVEVETPRTSGGDADQVRRATLASLGQSVAALFYAVELAPSE